MELPVILEANLEFHDRESAADKKRKYKDYKIESKLMKIYNKDRVAMIINSEQG